jgi:hypothetical protein
LGGTAPAAAVRSQRFLARCMRLGAARRLMAVGTACAARASTGRWTWERLFAKGRTRSTSARKHQSGPPKRLVCRDRAAEALRSSANGAAVRAADAGRRLDWSCGPFRSPRGLLERHDHPRTRDASPPCPLCACMLCCPACAIARVLPCAADAGRRLDWSFGPFRTSGRPAEAPRSSPHQGCFPSLPPVRVHALLPRVRHRARDAIALSRK